MSDLSPADRGEASLGYVNLGQDTSDDVGLELPVTEVNKDQNADEWWKDVQTVVINKENANCPDDINRFNWVCYLLNILWKTTSIPTAD